MKELLVLLLLLTVLLSGCVEEMGGIGKTYDSLGDIVNNYESYEGKTVTLKAKVWTIIGTYEGDNLRPPGYIHHKFIDDEGYEIFLYFKQTRTFEDGTVYEVTGTIMKIQHYSPSYFTESDWEDWWVLHPEKMNRLSG